MSKEWLEDWLKDKKEQLKSATVFINENGNEAVKVSLSVLNKLFEQTERVLELEKEIEDWRAEVQKWQRFLREESQQNKRYCEALEFYANEKSWMNREVTILMDGEPTDVEDCPAIFDDGGNIARQALEG